MPAIQQGDVAQESRLVAQRFHEEYERQWGAEKRPDKQPVEWRDMPPSYCMRLQRVFEALMRKGNLAVGPGIGFQIPDEDT